MLASAMPYKEEENGVKVGTNDSILTLYFNIPEQYTLISSWNNELFRDIYSIAGCQPCLSSPFNAEGNAFENIVEHLRCMTF